MRDIVDCGSNLGFEDGNLSNWEGCYFSGCPVGQKFPNSCPADCFSTSLTYENGAWVCTCNSCGAGSSPTKSPCCPIKCDQAGLQPGVNSVNGTLGTCSALTPTAGNVRHTVTTGGGTDPNSDGNIPVVAPGGGNFSVRIGNQEAGWEAECLSQSFTVSPQNALFTYMYAVVFMDPPGHTDDNRPRFEINITDPNGDPVPCGGEYLVVSKDAESQEGFKKATSPNCSRDSEGDTTNVWYKEWTPVATDLSSFINQQVTIKFCTADCGQGGHWGYAYVDTYCSPLEVLGTRVCSTDPTVTLTAPSGFSSYEWFEGQAPGTPPSIGNSIDLTVPVVDGGIYTVKLENVATPGCYTYITDTVEVFSAEATGDTTVCRYSTSPLQLTASGSDDETTYSWSPTTGLSCSTCPNPQVNPPFSDITYTVTMTSSLGCVITEDISITAIECPPNVTATADSLCEGGCGDVTAIGTGGTPPYTWTWSPNIGTEAGPYNECPTSTTVYHVTITDALGEVDSTTTTFVVYPVPTVTMTPDLNVCSDDDPTSDLTATVNGGTGPFTYVWDDPNSGNTSTITVTNVLNTSVTYHVSITDINGCTTDGEVTVTTACSPFVTLDAAEYCQGGCTTLEPQANGGAPPYTWNWDNPTLNGPGPFDVCPTVTTTYCVTVTDLNGATASTCATVTVNDPPVLTTSSTTATCGQCDGSVTVTATGAGPFDYLWSSGCTTATCQNMCTGNYSVTVTDDNGCQSEISQPVSNTNAPEIQAIPDSVACFGDCDGTVVAIVTSTGTPPYSFQWSPAGTDSVLTGQCAGTYTVTITDQLGCQSVASTFIYEPSEMSQTVSHTDLLCYGDQNGTITWIVEGGTLPYTFNWTPGGYTTASLTGLASGTYNGTVTDANGCTQTTSATIIEPTPLVLSITHTNTTCSNDDGTVTVTASGATPPYSYIWNNGGTTSGISGLVPGTYSVTVTDVNGCEVTTDDAVQGIPLPAVDISGSTDPLCYGDCTGTATAQGSGGTPPYNYGWNDAANQTGATATGLCAGEYKVCLTDANGCPACDSVVINQPPPVTLSTGATDEICHDSTGTVYATPGGGTPPYTLIWSDPTGSTTDTVAGLKEGTYSVTATDANGCVITGSDMVENIQILPVAHFVPDPYEALLMNPVISFFDKSSDAISWVWDFGDSSTSTLQNPIHTYSDTGCYDVSLWIINQYGCEDSIETTVCVKDISSIYIPNAFTPNQDGKNEYFTVGQYNYCEFEMYIFDRWGNLIFKTTSLKGWDGTANNGTEIAQEDVYVWLVKAVDCYGNPWKRVGHVTLIR
ncbi:MAG: gliding motility-associated C-terminal domain-containing protein [Flavobacteriales bacterium]|nr:gliding motility-associated C-terminal domain-containing protein [Flavobacteriales bacterium]